MSVIDQVIGEKSAIYNADCMEVMKEIPDGKIALSIYSPPFGGLYNYSSDERDLSNCDNYGEFFKQYEYIVKELARITMPGRMTCVHCMDVPRSNSGTDSYIDFPGDIIRLHEKLGFEYASRRSIWKEPLAVRLRTMQKNLAHKTICEDSIDGGVAGADYLLAFRKKGKNEIPVQHPNGLMDYAGERIVPPAIMKFRGYEGKQTENRFSQWIWRQYADCMWDDVRLNRVLPFREGKDPEDEKHVHPLQLDVIDRCVILYSNEGETCFTPFMGVGSEVYSPVLLGRKAIGAELKPSYFRQAVKNVLLAEKGIKDIQSNHIFDFDGDKEVLD